MLSEDEEKEDTDENQQPFRMWLQRTNRTAKC